MEVFRVGNRRVLVVDGADIRYERLTGELRMFLQQGIGVLTTEPDRLQLYAGRPDASGRPGTMLLLLPPLLLELSESGDDILISRILLTRDPLEPI